MRTTVVTAVALSLAACGEAGSTNESDDMVPFETVQLELSGATKVEGGAAYSCALKSNGTVTCWGATNSTLPFSDYVDIAPGAHHLCALRANGSVLCIWVDSYYNGFGELNAPAIPMSDVSAGLQVTCGIRASDQGLQCWGRNDHGQADPPAGQYARVEVGWAHACALRTDQTGVDCWGLDAHGQADGFIGAVTDFAAGGYHTCYVRAADDSAICSNGGFPPPVQFVQLTAGLEHTCGRMTNGSIACWGDNSFGQGGYFNLSYAYVGAGANHTCRLRPRTNLVECWGDNSHGQTIPPP